MKIVGIIPARYASTRLPGKPLIGLKGKSMVKSVYDNALQAKYLNDVVVATDNHSIYHHVENFGGKVVMTHTRHKTGTDRCAEAYEKLDEYYDFVINIQCDEPFLPPLQLDVLSSILDEDVQIGTLVKKIDDLHLLFNPNTPKVIFTKDWQAIYFSRQSIPFNRDHENQEWMQHHTYYKHIGIYAYRSDILKIITHLPVSGLEQAESLEQLRWIENGYKIKLQETEYESYGIDTPEDLEIVKKMIEKGEL